MMAQSRTESTRDTYNYGQYINQFPPNTIKVIREFERIQKKICRHKMSIMFNEICIYICVCVCVSQEDKQILHSDFSSKAWKLWSDYSQRYLLATYLSLAEPTEDTDTHWTFGPQNYIF